MKKTFIREGIYLSILLSVSLALYIGSGRLEKVTDDNHERAQLTHQILNVLTSHVFAAGDLKYLISSSEDTLVARVEMLEELASQNDLDITSLSQMPGTIRLHYKADLDRDVYAYLANLVKVGAKGLCPAELIIIRGIGGVSGTIKFVYHVKKAQP